MPLPKWAWPGRGGLQKDTTLRLVNRRYHWHIGRLTALRISASIVRLPYRAWIEDIISDEIARCTDEFNRWKADNAPR